MELPTSVPQRSCSSKSIVQHFANEQITTQSSLMCAPLQSAAANDEGPQHALDVLALTLTMLYPSVLITTRLQHSKESMHIVTGSVKVTV